MATHSSSLVWKIPQTEEPGGLQSMGSQNIRQLSYWVHTHVKRTFLWEIQSTLTPGLTSITVSCVRSIYFFISFLEAEPQTASQLELLDGWQDQQWWRRRSSPSYPPTFLMSWQLVVVAGGDCGLRGSSLGECTRVPPLLYSPPCGAHMVFSNPSSCHFPVVDLVHKRLMVSFWTE